MKYIFVLIISISTFSITTAQEKQQLVTFGVKAGLNYGDNGKITFSDIANASENLISQNANDRIGYHIGVFLRAKILDKFYLKPELQYTQNNSTYSLNNKSIDYNIKKIDTPILIGVSILGPLHIFTGPALQYIVTNKLEDVNLGDVKNEFTVGLQFGTGVQLGPINADIRYERGFNKNEAQNITENFGQTIRVDSRPNQFIISIAICDVLK